MRLSPHLLPLILDRAEALVEAHGRGVGAFELVQELQRHGVQAWLPYQLPDRPPDG